MLLLQSDFVFKLVLTLLLLDVVDDSLCEGFVPHEVLALVQTVVRI